MNDETLDAVNDAIQQAVDSGQFAIAITYCDAKEVKQFFHAVKFPHASIGDAVRLLLNSLLLKP